MSDALTPNEAKALADIEFSLTSPHTLEEIADHLGVSVMTVFRIEARALAKLRDLASDEWQGGTRSPVTLQRGVWEVFPSNGMTPTEDPE